MDHKQRTKRHEHKKRQLDMLHGSLWNKLIIFALPLALTGVLQQLFNAADVAVLGQFVGTHAMAAVGNNTPVISLFVTLFLGLSLGANVVIARYWGHAVRSRPARPFILRLCWLCWLAYCS